MKRFLKFLMGLVLFVLVVSLGGTLVADALIWQKPDFNTDNANQLVDIDFSMPDPLKDPSVYISGIDCNGHFYNWDEIPQDCPAFVELTGHFLMIGVGPDPDLLTKTNVVPIYGESPENYNNGYTVFNNNGSCFTIPDDGWLWAEVSLEISQDHVGSMGDWWQPCGAIDLSGNVVYPDRITGAGFGYIDGDSFYAGPTLNYYSVGSTWFEKNISNPLISLLKMKHFDREYYYPLGTYRIAIKKFGAGNIVCVSSETVNADQMRCQYTPGYSSDQVDFHIWSDNLCYPNHCDTDQYVRYRYFKVYETK